MTLAEEMRRKAVSKKPSRQELSAAASAARRRLAKSPDIIEREVAFQLATGKFAKWLRQIDEHATRGERSTEFLLGVTSDPFSNEYRLQGTDMFRDRGFRVFSRTAQRVYTDKRRRRREPEELFLIVSW